MSNSNYSNILLSEYLLNKIGSPYPLGESFRLIFKQFYPNKKNSGSVFFTSKNLLLNPITPKIKIGFIGDIMGVSNKKLLISNRLKSFFSDCDLIVGNYEGTLTSSRKNRPFDEKHCINTSMGLSQLFPIDKIYLSLANNHAGDFEQSIFHQGLDTLKTIGFNVFGTSNSPFIDLSPNVRIFTGTCWSNKKRGWKRVSDLSKFNIQKSKLSDLNILFPHWGYEMELYPRDEIIDKGANYLKHFDAIIGHHPHLPQPVTLHRTTNQNKFQLCAYSLGDFCIGRSFPILKTYNYGMILKMEIGTHSKSNGWAIGHTKWRFIYSKPRKSTIKVDICEKLPFI